MTLTSLLALREIKLMLETPCPQGKGSTTSSSVPVQLFYFSNHYKHRYCFWLKTMRGEENCKFLCADSEADMLKLMAAIIQAKVIVIVQLVNYV